MDYQRVQNQFDIQIDYVLLSDLTVTDNKVIEKYQMLNVKYYIKKPLNMDKLSSFLKE